MRTSLRGETVNTLVRVLEAFCEREPTFVVHQLTRSDKRVLLEQRPRQDAQSADQQCWHPLLLAEPLTCCPFRLFAADDCLLEISGASKTTNRHPVSVGGADCWTHASSLSLSRVICDDWGVVVM